MSAWIKLMSSYVHDKRQELMADIFFTLHALMEILRQLFKISYDEGGDVVGGVVEARSKLKVFMSLK